MSKSKKPSDTKPIGNVEETLSKTELFIEDNYRSLLYGLAIVAVVVGTLWLIKIRIGNRSEEALSQMYVAEEYFSQDSLNLALYGDGNYLGFLDIISQYKITKAGNLAKYYAGVCYLNLGQFEDAISMLKTFKKKDKAVSPVALGCIGDAYVELGDNDLGIEFYLKASSFSENEFYNPLYLMKAGELYELSGNNSKALEIYTKIQDEYPNSNEGNNIAKYIARLKATN